MCNFCEAATAENGQNIFYKKRILQWIIINFGRLGVGVEELWNKVPKRTRQICSYKSFVVCGNSGVDAIRGREKTTQRTDIGKTTGL